MSEKERERKREMDAMPGAEIDCLAGKGNEEKKKNGRPVSKERERGVMASLRYACLLFKLPSALYYSLLSLYPLSDIHST